MVSPHINSIILNFLTIPNILSIIADIKRKTAGGHNMADIKLEDLLDRIYCASAEELNSIINTCMERFSEIWPEWELMTLSVHGHDAESQIETLQKSIDLLCSNK